MAAPEHLLVLFSIVIGLGLTELLSSFHNLVHPATRTKWHWLPAFWASNVFLSVVFWWWMMSFFGRLEEDPGSGISLGRTAFAAPLGCGSIGDDANAASGLEHQGAYGSRRRASRNDDRVARDLLAHD